MARLLRAPARAVLLGLAGLALAGAGALLALRPRAPRTDAEARARLSSRRPAPAGVNLVLVTLDTLRAYAECGVDYISVGALTHQIKSIDLSLKAL